MKDDTVKINFNISVELLKKIDDYANSLHINRTSAMCVLMSQSLEQKEGLNSLRTMSNFFSNYDFQNAKNLPSNSEK